MNIYDDDGWLELSPSQISTLLDKCSYKWYLSKKGYIDISLIDTSFPGRVVHFLQEIVHPMKRAGKFFDPESREFKRLIYNTWNREILKGYRIKKSMEAKYRLMIEEKYPKLFKEPINQNQEQKIYKKICRFIEKDLFQATLKYCNVYLKDIFPLQNPAIDDDGNVKKEQWCTLKLPNLKVILRMRYDLLEEGDLLTDTKVLASQSCPAKDPVKELAWMGKQEQYMFYSMWYREKYGVVPTNRQYTIKKNVKPVYIPLPDVKYTQGNYEVIVEKVRAAKRIIETEAFYGNNGSNLCSVDYCGFWPHCKYVHREGK